MRLFIVSLILLATVSCAAPAPAPPPTWTPPPTQPIPTQHAPASFQLTPLPTRTRWQFGELLPYTTQSGDTLKAVAAHFNTDPDSIRQANPNAALPDGAMLDPGQPLSIPANYAPLTGTPYRIIPDSELVWGPAQKTFVLKATILEHNGFLSRYSEYAEEKTRPSWEIIERVARDYSINPRLLLALVEYRSGALTHPSVPGFTYPLGYEDPLHTGLHKQLVWAAEQLSRGYYGWRHGTMVEVMAADGMVERIDFWQNAGTASLHTLFAALLSADQFEEAVSPEGFGATYQSLFGDPFKYEVTLFPAGSRQPDLILPFRAGRTWSYTGGPHPVWGDDTPWGALDFTPPAVGIGCGYSSEWVAAMADGVIARSDEAAVVLDLDGDGDEHTGWIIFYYHMGLDALPPVGKVVKMGDPLGHGSCDGGRATGTHVHVARRYNGEWIAADGLMPFVLSGWTAHVGSEPYKGTLTYDLPALRIEACICVAASNAVTR
ncbi:MAG: LysM peptidoglycan-binding domain-containing protein [Chloroflexi bacterium]|nr:LysM peptidoglycan-binding domain-containing protein [Chloroflexota bacterium]